MLTQGPDRMVTHNAVKIQLAGTRQVHVRATDFTVADHSRFQGITTNSNGAVKQYIILIFSCVFQLSFTPARERESETFKMARFEANPE